MDERTKGVARTRVEDALTSPCLWPVGVEQASSTFVTDAVTDDGSDRGCHRLRLKHGVSLTCTGGNVAVTQ